MSNIRRAVALTVASTIFAPGVAHAATWSAPTAISAAPVTEAAIDPAGQTVAADAAGNLTAAWVQVDAPRYAVVTATKPVGGAWSAPTTISKASSPSGLTLQVSPAGHAIAGWIDRVDNRVAPLRVASRTPAGVWTEAEAIQPDSSPYTSAPGYTGSFGLGIGEDGEAVGFWTREFLEMLHPDSRGFESRTTSRAAGGAWVAGSALPAGSAFDLAVDAEGTATLTFISPVTGDLKASTRPSGGDWSAPTVVAAAGPALPEAPPYPPSTELPNYPLNTSLDVNAKGDVAVSWVRRSGDDLRIEVARHAKGAAFGAAEQVATVANGADLPYGMPPGGTAVDLDAAGRATVAWVENAAGAEPARSIVKAADAKGGAAWSIPTAVSAPLVTTAAEIEAAGIGPFPPSYYALQVAAGGDGHAVATWVEQPKIGSALAAPEQVQAARRLPGAAWEPAQTLGALDRARNVAGGGYRLPSTVVDGSGTATLVYPTDQLQARTLAGGGSGPVDPVDPVPTRSVTVTAAVSPLFGATKCPAKLDVWTAPKRVTAPATRTVTGRTVRCTIAAKITLPASTRVGAAVPALVTGWGVWPAVVTARVTAG